jgi:hypothetical protein
MAEDPKTQDPNAPAAPPPEKEKTPSHLTVLILRDERVGEKDYKPGDTPKLTYAEAQRLIARGGADGDSGAVRAAQAQRKAQTEKKA